MTSVQDRVTVIRSLVGHRKPSEHLLELIRLVCDGASLEQVWEYDAQQKKAS